MRNRGFVSLYMLVILSAAIVVSSMLTTEITRYHQFVSQRKVFRKINWLEVLAINRIKDCYRNYAEKDETVWIEGFSITFTYHDLECTFVIRGEGNQRIRKLYYDDLENWVTEYE